MSNLAVRTTAGRRRIDRRRVRRRARILSLRRWVKHGIAPDIRAFDPLQRGSGTRMRRIGGPLLVGLAAIGLHAAVVVGLIWISRALGTALPASQPERLAVTIVDVPADPEPEVEVEQPTPPAQKVKPAEPARRPLPDPVAEPPPEEPAPQPETPIRRIVGLSMESTVVGGSGPAFAVGNTRMGETATTATEPTRVATLDPQGRNRVATRVPRHGVTITRPRVKGEPVEPEYPAILEAQGIEGDVVLVMTIDTSGSVIQVRILRGSSHEAFDEAAVAAAYRRRFHPATRNREPIQTTQKSTIKFRLRDE